MVQIEDTQTADLATPGRVANFSVLAAVLAFVSSACCILPMVFMLVGMGGGWLAAVGAFSIASPYLIVLSIAMIIFAWFVAARRGATRSVKRLLAISTVLTLGALPLLIFEVQLNDFLIGLM